MANETKKYASLENLRTFKSNLDTEFATINHSHSTHTQQNMSNTDLDTIKDAGWYYGYTGMTNAPAQSISVMEVLKYSPDWIVQKFIVVNGAEYIRHWHSGKTWSNWETNIDSGNISSQSVAQATKATKDGNGKVISDTYETKADSTKNFEDAKAYADNAATQVKNDLLNGAGGAYDTLKELGDLIDENTDAIDALERVAAGKANSEHSHPLSEIVGLQNALNNKATLDHGLHVTFDDVNKPQMDGVAAVGTSDAVAKADHVHPTDTTRVSQETFDLHDSDTTKHITATERSNWNDAKAHADSTHVTGVKGNSESTYRTGNVNITKANIGLGNVDNTSDANKPVSTAQQAAIDNALEAAKAYTDAETDNFISFSHFTGHNTSTSAHNDIRELISGLTTRLNTLADSDDTTLDQLSEIVAYIKSNKDLIDAVTTSKVSVSDIVNDLETNIFDVPLSAAQGVALKSLIDILQEDIDFMQEDVDGKAPLNHTHDDRYYTEAEINGKVDTINASITNIINGTTVVDSAKYATNAQSASSANKATKDSNNNVIVDTYASINYVDEELAKKAVSSHTHDDRYYTEAEIDNKINPINNDITQIILGTIPVGKANYATEATNANIAIQASKDGSGNIITNTYATINYVDEELMKKSHTSHNHDSKYYTKTQIDNFEFITVDDIDTICGTTIQVVNLTDSGVTF